VGGRNVSTFNVLTFKRRDAGLGGWQIRNPKFEIRNSDAGTGTGTETDTETDPGGFGHTGFGDSVH
jgi:hypothetical protein